MRKRLIILL